MAILLFFCSGIIFVGCLPELPSLSFLLALLSGAFFCTFFLHKKFPFVLCLLFLLLGFCYGTWAGSRLLENQILPDLVERDLVIEGRVTGLPQENNRRQLFSFAVKQAYSAYDHSASFEHFPDKLNISSYSDLRVKTGEEWRLTVKLKRPRGFVNPGGFDYQASLLRRGVGATGYIRQDENLLLKPQPKFSIDVLRFELQQWLINKSQSTEKGILVALLVGDTSLVDRERWGEMIKTGTNHLIAISGLHLGFFAIVGFFIGNLIGRCVQIFWHKYPSVVSGYIFSVLFTFFYSLIAGFNIPTIRTLIMLVVVQLMLLWRRSFRARDSLLIALVLVLLYDPLAAYDIGFWLSFCAVGMLIFCFSGRIQITRRLGLMNSTRNYLIVFVKSQWVMFIGLLIPLAILIHTSSLLAPPANFVAIPLVTFFVVPCLIISALCHFSFPGLEDFFLHCAEWGMHLVHKWLNYLLIAGTGKLNPLINFNPCAIGVAVLSVFLILLPRGIGNKYIGAAGLILSLLVPLKSLPELQMLVFDVGQGTAVLVRTPNHQLLYDTGPLYTENFDAGSGIIVPYLQSQGIESLDVLVVSHNDQDHIGGLDGVLAATQVKKLWLGEPEKLQRNELGPGAENCHIQKPWQWDQINFQFVSWPIQPNAKANNHSCVLMVEFNGHRILLAGDIEKEVERNLVAQESLAPVDILLAPHHGSHTSSTAEFVARVRPQTVVYSAGFHNQHGHPHADIKARYDSVGAMPLNTALSGALEFTWQDDSLKIIQYRQSARRYWFDVNE
ncbi:DNA internalization-related competence protein ComEC/Rec2 [Cellvibrio zantedeschiae]|uniref:DNA internalization-related competence protein ComEC/Rec2 n=1 Tax=Cellvibrio zantedeschiae TaxID=1237077 RepID=A0ABQ3AYL0_9GAMM|nr:DNA internalization-related competence protein ComEC/Rec2 [Cellvibrio zantedeschiae]GGY71437.1 DNA internalization-related competence protein ComEC/Rec2 [Cellvibrio zantedeschiae]